MDPERITNVMDRIATAAERIAVSARRSHAASADTELDRRHRALREDAASALEEVDQLLLALDR